MPDQRQSSFGSGEWSPSLYGADHLDGYGQAARIIRNFVATKARTLVNRSGTIYCHEVSDSADLHRLLPFNFGADQNYCLELGDRDLRVTAADGTAVLAEALVTTRQGTAQRSTDGGATWVAGAMPWGGAAVPQDSCEGADGRLFIVGAAGRLAYTDDRGASWTEVVLPVGGANLYAVAFNGRRLLASGSTGLAYSDDNGVTWTAVSAPPVITIEGLAWGNGRWIAVGYDVVPQARYSFSYDGITWAVPASVGNLDAVHASTRLHDVCYCAGQFLAVGDTLIAAHRSLLCQIGTLAANWAWTSPTAGHHVYGVASDSLTTAVAVGVVDGGGACAYRFDSVTGAWASIIGVPAGTGFYDVAYSRGYWVMVGDDGAASHCARYDGSTWTPDPVLPGIGYSAIATCIGTETLSLATPWPSSENRDLAFAQSGDVTTIFHLNHPPLELCRFGAHDWRTRAWYKVPPTRVVGGLIFTPAANQTEDDTHKTKPWEVVVTWEDEETGAESLPSSALIAVGGATPGRFLVYPDRPQSYQWNVVEKARRYHVYRGQNGEWGWIGSVKQPEVGAGVSPTTVTWTDGGHEPIVSENPPEWVNPFQSDLSYPACGCYLDDRFVVGGSLVQPATIRGSHVSDYYNFDEPLIPDETSPFEYTLATRRFEEIRWLVPLELLIAGTSESEWVAAGADGGAITADKPPLCRAKANRPAAKLQPVVVGNGIVYAQVGGQVIRYFKPTRDVLTASDPGIWGGFELTKHAAHLFEGKSVIDWAYAQSPDSIVWAVLSDGALCSLTFIPEDGVWAWARHDSGGDAFEAVCVISDGTRDVAFFIVRRTIGGLTKRYVERLATRTPATATVAVFLDSSVTYTGVATNIMAGLSHLEGRTVGVLADGTYRGTYVVGVAGGFPAGQVTFSGAAATTVVAGLPITADFESLDYPQGRTRQKRVGRVGLEYRLNPATTDTAAGVSFGESAATVEAIRKFSDARDGMLEVPVPSAWNPGGRVFLRHTMPFAIEIRGITREVK